MKSANIFMKNFLLKLLFLGVLLPSTMAQEVGLVLSGGGSAALAHIGVLKALEEHEIPIDYISGTSMGAIVGAMYASGVSPVEMEVIVNSDDFQELMLGNDEPQYRRFLNAKPNNASIISLRFYIDSVLATSVPTNYVKPYAMDFKLLEMFAPVSAAAHYQFDSLMVPFRCVASDISNKQQVVFRNGNLEQAIRASASYPFYYNPITIDGNLLYDGGLYNNFPSDILCQDFNPDYIIGSNVSYNYEAPNENNLFSIIRNMLVNETNYGLSCGEGTIITPNTNYVSTFDFGNVQAVIDSGYQATIAQIATIKANINRTVPTSELVEKRKQFQAKLAPLKINNIHINGLSKFQRQYVKNTFKTKTSTNSLSDLKGKYYRAFANDKIKYIFPRAHQEDSTDYFNLSLDVTREKDLFIDFGGNFSSKPINTGYVGLKYNYLGAAGLSFAANSYFGKFYGSINTQLTIDFPTRIPLMFSPVFTLNRWDYFNSRATFFEESKPSFKIIREQFYGLIATVPIIGGGNVSADFKQFTQDYLYYQTENFDATDTSDNSKFSGLTYGLSYNLNTLNAKQFANEGGRLYLNARFINGKEKTIPGSTALGNQETEKDKHNWLQVKLELERYFRIDRKIRFGIQSKLFWSNQPFFSNYTATLMSSTAYQPTLESKSLFLNQFRAHKFIGSGLIAETNIWKNLVLRGAFHVFQPFQELRREADTGDQFRGESWERRRYIAAATLLFRNPIAPVSLSLNYNDENPKEFSLMFNFGYLLFNKGTAD